jgi:hypothetical protein
MNTTCNNYEENEAVCYSDGEPKGQCANCGFDESEHTSDDLNDVKNAPLIENILKSLYELKTYHDFKADPTPIKWEPISTAPKGGGADNMSDPKWVDPPVILLLLDDGKAVMARWDYYFDKGGNGYTDGCAWTLDCCCKTINTHYNGKPTHWMPLPKTIEVKS